MINSVILEGFVVRTWTFAGDRFYRIVSNRDPGLPPKPRDEEKDAADFMTVRVPKGSLGGPVSLEVEHLVGATVSCRAGIMRKRWQTLLRERRVPS